MRPLPNGASRPYDSQDTSCMVTAKKWESILLANATSTGRRKLELTPTLPSEAPNQTVTKS